MEIKDILEENNIIGVIGNYESTFDVKGKVKDLDIKNIDKALIMVNLDEDIINSNIKDLTISELWKVELMSKLEDDLIIIGNMYNSLIYKDIEYMKKLFIKLCNDYNKKIIIIDSNLKAFFNLTKTIVFTDNKEIVYKTNDYYDNKLFNYIDKPNIISFVEYVNRNEKVLNETTDIYELIKDIYRGVS